MLSISHTDLVVVTDVLHDQQSDMSEYGIDKEGDTPELQTRNDVSVPGYLRTFC